MVSSSPMMTGAPIGMKTLISRFSSWRAAARDEAMESTEVGMTVQRKTAVMPKDRYHGP
jgi:hypothetical protein